MNSKPDLPERLGKTVNELDIDFSRFTLAGWLVSIASLIAGGGTGYGLALLVAGNNGWNRNAGFVFGISMIIVTVVSFLVLRKIALWLGIKVVR